MMHLKLFSRLGPNIWVNLPLRKGCTLFVSKLILRFFGIFWMENDGVGLEGAREAEEKNIYFIPWGNRALPLVYTHYFLHYFPPFLAPNWEIRSNVGFHDDQPNINYIYFYVILYLQRRLHMAYGLP